MARLKWMGVEESKLPGQVKSLSLIPAGAWLEAVGASGTPSYPVPLPIHLYDDSRGLRRAGRARSVSVPLSPLPHPHAPRSQTLLFTVGSVVASLGVPLRSDSHEDTATLDFSSLLRKR